MKRLSIALLLMLCVSSAFAEVVYFGATATTSGVAATAARTYFNYNLKYQATTPGPIVELSAYVKSNGGTPGNMRLALYNSDRTVKICEGSAEVLVSSTTAAWVAHTGLTGTCSVSTGVDYTLALTVDSADVYYYYATGTTGDWGYISSADYTGGFPEPLTGTVTTSSGSICIRVGTVKAKYWVGGSGNWSDAANHWATLSGGTPDAANLPTCYPFYGAGENCDSVIFDANSHTTSYTVTVDQEAYCRDIVFSNPASGTVTFAGSAPLHSRAGTTFASGMTVAYDGVLEGCGVFTSNGVSFSGSLSCDDINLADDLTLSGNGKGLRGYVIDNNHTITITGNDFLLIPDNALYALTVTPSEAATLRIGSDLLQVVKALTLTGHSPTERIKVQSARRGVQRSLFAGTIIAQNADFHGVSVSITNTGSHNGSGDSASLVDTTKDFVTWGTTTGQLAYNTVDGSYGIITGITTTTNANDTLTMTLVGGTENDWDAADTYVISDSIMTTGTHNGAGDSASLVDTTKDFSALGVTVGSAVKNLTDSIVLTGTHNGADGSASLIDTTKNFTTLGVRVGSAVKNVTDGSTATVTTITTTTNPSDTLTMTLTGGTDHDWDASDSYLITHDSLGTVATITTTTNQNDTLAMTLAGGTENNWDASDAYRIITGRTLDFSLAGATGGSGDLGNNDGLAYTTAATRYWVGNGGNWSDTAHWSTSSGGSGGASVPLAQDTVVFDTSSITTAGQTITIDAANMGRDVSFAAGDVGMSLAFTGQHYITGSLTLGGGVGMVATPGSIVWLSGDGTHTITSNGRSLPAGLSLAINATGTYTLQDDLTLSSTGILWLYQGTLSANNHNVTTGAFRTRGKEPTKVLTMGSGNWTITGNDTIDGQAVFEIDRSATAQTITPGTSTIRFTDETLHPKTLLAGTTALYDLWYTTAAKGPLRVHKTPTFNSVTGNTGAIQYDPKEYITTLAWDSPCAAGSFCDTSWRATTETIRVYEIVGGSYVLAAEGDAYAMQITFLHGGPAEHQWVVEVNNGITDSDYSNVAAWSHRGGTVRWRIRQ